MSAYTTNKENHLYYFDRRLHPTDEAILFTIFDNNVNQDIEEIEFELTQIKSIKKLCLFKTLSFPLELIVLLFNRKLLKHRWAYQKTYYKFLRNKITYKEFKSELLGKSAVY